jgi:hypothetical protein
MDLSLSQLRHIVISCNSILRKGVMETVDPVVRDFILFCIQRQGKAWPALYDEMCWVAGHRLFMGLSYSDLRRLGLSFSLTNIKDTIRMVYAVTADKGEQVQCQKQ